MGGGHVGEQLALFFGLCQLKPSLTFSSAALSLQPPGRLARPALLVPKGWDVAVPHHGVGHATPAMPLRDGHAACYRGKAASSRHLCVHFLVGLGRTPRPQPWLCPGTSVLV